LDPDGVGAGTIRVVILEQVSGIPIWEDMGILAGEAMAAVMVTRDMAI